MGTAQLILLGIQIAEAAAQAIPEAIAARDAVERMLAEDRDPTDAEWEVLNAVTVGLTRRIQGG